MLIAFLIEKQCLQKCTAICHACMVYVLLVLSFQRLYLAPLRIGSKLYFIGFCVVLLVLCVFFLKSNLQLYPLRVSELDSLIEIGRGRKTEKKTSVCLSLRMKISNE